MQKKTLSIFKRGCANVIDYLITGITSVLLVFLCGIVFGLSVTDSGYYIGAITLRHSYICESRFLNQDGIANGEIWTIIIVVFASALSQYLSERHFSATVGVKIMGGVCVSQHKPLTQSQALHRFLARVCYFPTMFIFITHIIDFSALAAIASMLFVSFVSLLKSQRTIIERLTDTDTTIK